MSTSAVPNDVAVALGNQWALGSSQEYGIGAFSGWDVRSSAADVIVAVLDTGIHLQHQDLINNLWVNTGEIPMDGIDNDGNGWVDDVHGVNFITPETTPNDDNGHGTHVAGIIGAEGNNALGIAGVAWNVQLMALKALEENGLGTTSDTVTALYYARDHGANLINVSWGTSSSSMLLSRAIRDMGRADCIVVAAAGNSRTNNDFLHQYPAYYGYDHVVSVAASNREGALTGFSNTGDRSVDFAAPGEDILSTYTGAVDAYRLQSGTSMATPYVTGILALLKAEYPDDSYVALIQRIRTTVEENERPEMGRIRHRGIPDLRSVLEASYVGRAGDLPEKAIELSFPVAHWRGGNTGAGSDPKAVYPNANRSMWYRYRCQKSGWVEVNFTAEREDARMRIFEEGGGQTAEVDISGEARTEFFARQGKDYTVVVDDHGLVSVEYEFELARRPDNDQLLNAKTLPDFPSYSVGYTNGATSEIDEDLQTTLGEGRSVWYRWEAQRNAPVMVNLEFSNCDTVMAVYRQTAGGPVLVDAQDDFRYRRWSQITFDALLGETYIISVDVYRDTQPGEIRINGYYADEIEIVVPPEPQTVRLGDAVNMEVVARSGPPLRYQWFRDGRPIFNATSPRFALSRVREMDLGSYHVEITNDYATKNSSSIHLSEKTSSPWKLWQSGSRKAVIGQTAEFRVIAEGSRPLTYEWFRNGQPIPDSNLPILTLLDVQPEDAGTYQAKVANAYGDVLTVPVQLSTIDDPLKDWNWRAPTPWGGDIVDLDYAGGFYYALVRRPKDGLLLRSTDGTVWTEVPLPEGIIPTSFWMETGNYVIAGYAHGEEESPVLFSTDGNTWEKRLTDFGARPAQIVSLNGFYALRTQSSSLGGGIWISTDGVEWVKSPVSLSEEIAVGNGLLVGLTNNGSNTRVTSDGVNWEEGTVPLSGSGLVFVNGRFHTNFNSFQYASSDGVNWAQISSTRTPGEILMHDGTHYIALTNEKYWTATTFGNWSDEVLLKGVKQPRVNFEDNLLDAIYVNGRFIIGGLDSLLVAADSVEEIQFTREYSKLPDSYDGVTLWHNDEMLLADGQLLHRGYRSGDGVEWTDIPGWTGTHSSTLFAVNGFFYTLDAGGYGTPQQITRGITPYYFEPVEEMDHGVLDHIVYKFGRYWAMFRAQYATNEQGQPTVDGFITSLDGKTWTQVSGFTPGDGGGLHEWGDFLLVDHADGLFLTPDGITWTPLNFSLANSHLAASDTTLAISGARKLFYSTDGGTTWTESSPAPATASYYHDDLVYFNGSFMLMYENEAWVYDLDQDTWDRVELPNTFSYFQPFHGTLLGGEDGVVMQSGNTPAPAPIAAFAMASARLRAVEGSTVPVSFMAAAPEGSVTRVEFWAGEELVYSGTSAGEFQARVQTDQPGTIGIKVVVTNDAGLSSAEYGTIEVTTAPRSAQFALPPSLTDATVFHDYIYSEVDGVFARSLDGLAWESVPFGAGGAIEVDGLLVGLNGNTIMTSQDGVNWYGHDFLSELSYDVETPLMYRDGWFVLYAKKLREGILAVSRDGIEWHLTKTALWDLNSIVLGDGGQGILFQSSSHNGHVFPFQITPTGGITFASQVDMPSGTLSALFAKDRFYMILENAALQHSFDGETWTDVNWTGKNPTRIREVGTRLFLLYGAEIIGTSVDGLVWEPTPSLTGNLYFLEDRYGLIGQDGMLWVSTNGLEWTEQGPVPFTGAQYVFPELHRLPDGRYLASYAGNYAVSSDLISWSLVYPANPVPEVAVEGFWLGRENGKLYRSGNQGESWQPVVGLGNLTSSYRIIATTGGVFITNQSLVGWFSSDGITWQPLESRAYFDFKYDPDRHRFLGLSYKSSDSSASIGYSTNGHDWEWRPLAGVPNPRDLHRIGNDFFVIGKSLGSTPDPVMKSQDGGDTWVDLDNTFGFDIYGGQMIDGMFYRVVSGWLVSTSDFENWNQRKDIPFESTLRVLEKFTGGDGVFFALDRDEILYESSDGVQWTLVAHIPEATRIRYVHGELYIDTQMGHVLFTDKDFALTGVGVAAGDFGVGDLLEIDLQVWNRGENLELAQSLDVEFRLSRDQIWGNDIHLGSDQVSPVPSQESSMMSTHSVVLPNTLLAGDYYVLARLDGTNSVYEINEMNNYGSTSEPVVRVQDRTLTLTVEEGGVALLSNTHLQYSNNQRISIGVLGSKEGTFSGWSGDTEGGVELLTLSMDSDREITAHFQTHHLLLISVEGGGTEVLVSSGTSFSPNSLVTVRAVPNPGWSFVRWEGDISSTAAETTVTMDAGKSIKAVFAQSYSDWVALHLNEEEGPMKENDADPDLDGFTNFEEYVAGTDPLDDKEPYPMKLYRQNGIFYLRYREKKGSLDVSTRFQKTHDLTGTWVDASASSRIVEETDEVRSIRVEIDTDLEPVSFYRMKYETP